MNNESGGVTAARRKRRCIFMSKIEELKTDLLKDVSGGVADIDLDERSSVNLGQNKPTGDSTLNYEKEDEWKINGGD